MNSFGRKFRVSIFGESHGPAIGIIIDGVEPGIELQEKDFEEDIARRKSGSKGTTARAEADQVKILSGVCDGHTTGAPLTLIFLNKDTRSADYDLLKRIPRPGHADYTASLKFNGFNDPRGGGHFSGRITLPIVAAGVVAKKMLPEVRIEATLSEIGGYKDKARQEEALENAIKEGDSLGGVVECTAEGLLPGLGEPFFDSVESLVSHAIFAIPGVRGVEFGDGFAAAAMKGSEHNDPLDTVRMDAAGGPGFVCSSKNGSGGVNGGITNGSPLKFRVAFKPTSSIRKAQRTYDISDGSMTDLSVPGRHDVCFALRTPVIVEAMTAIVLADLQSLSRICQ